MKRCFFGRMALTACALGLAACGGGGASGGSDSAKIGHVAIIVLENEDYDNSFAPDSLAPYLAKTLPAQGALLQNYYGIGHVSLDNYIAMISGQGPNLLTQSDCQLFQDFLGLPTALLSGQYSGVGCVYPATVPSLPDQLRAKGVSWRAYMEDMGNTPSREAATCGHPALNGQDGTQSATADDQYANRHNPFMYFHSVIDDTSYCDSHVVNLSRLDADLANDALPRFLFITPNLCHDGHDSPCANGEAGGLASINDFLSEWVPRIMASEAFASDGLLIVTFDESNGPQSDSTGCCAGFPAPNTPLPGIAGVGGGRVGAVLLSPYIKPGTVSTVPYNHYSMLRSVEDVFGLSYLGFAGDAASARFGDEVFTAQKPAFPAKD